MCNQDGPYGPESGAVTAHLANLQGIIGRMAGNSANCKAWCLTVATAAAGLIKGLALDQQVGLVFAPILLFCLLDAYYLGMERAFRGLYDTAVGQVQGAGIPRSEIFSIKPNLDLPWSMFAAVLSLSVWPFYGVLALGGWLLVKVL